jgi:SAM-dependent methyltransferase
MTAWSSFFWILTFTTSTFFQVFANSSSEEAFTNIYKNKVWGVNEQGEGFSGSGSTLQETTIYRSFLQNFLKTYNIRSVVDVGCGDWTFSKTIDWKGIDYIGIDVVKSVIDKNTALFKTPTVNFIHADILSTDLPAADLLICKDVLQHLPNGEIARFIKRLGKFKHCLLTNDIDLFLRNNYDIEFGQFRTLDLTCAPFFVKGVKILSYRGKAGVPMKQVLFIKN